MDNGLIINGIFTLIGAALGAYITYRCSLGLLWRAEYIKASAEFEIAFFGFIKWLKEDAIDTSLRVPGKLNDLHQHHLKAIACFRATIHGRKRRRFDAACERFYNKQNNRYYQGYVSPGKEEAINAALTNVYGLLHFTESCFLSS